jgi:hypothetical protein
MEFKRALTRTHVHSKYTASENAVVVCMILFESHVCFLSLLPYSTCFNRIDLPNYTSKKQMFERLKAAVTLCGGFGIE